MNIKERLLEFIAYKGIGQGKFEAIAGLSNGTINNIKKTVGADKIQKIICAYPEVNLHWLITGEGDMLKPSSENSEKQEPAITDSSLLRIIESQQKTISSQQTTIEELSKKTDAHQERDVKCANASGSDLVK